MSRFPQVPTSVKCRALRARFADGEDVTEEQKTEEEKVEIPEKGEDVVMQPERDAEPSSSSKRPAVAGRPMRAVTRRITVGGKKRSRVDGKDDDEADEEMEAILAEIVEILHDTVEEPEPKRNDGDPEGVA